jgi:anti-sigma factor RsiW
MTHPTEETLNDYLERELSPAEQVRVATHLETCADCARIVAELQQIVRDASALGPVEPPEHLWTAIQSAVASRQSTVASRQSTVASPESTAQSPQPRVQSRWPRHAWALATAALVVMAFLTGRMAQHRAQQSVLQQETETTAGRASADETAVRERVLLIAVGDHLERSQMVLVELAHAETRDELDISAERQLADDLVASNRLYRQTAQQMGQENVAGLLDELERVLVEVARGPSTVSMGQLADIQQRIEALGIVFKVKVIGSGLRQQPVSWGEPW